MVLGLNLTFAMKRWMKPERLARMCGREFGVRHVQFTWDFIDPWWPEEYRDVMAKEYREAFAAEGVKLDSTFGGSASYCFAHLLAPMKAQREAAFLFSKRSIDLTRDLGSEVMGMPTGGYDYEDARDPVRREALYQEMLGYVRKLADYGAEKGLKEIHIEPTPLFTEEPYNLATTMRLMRDLEGTEIPVKLLIDWGHALYKPLLKEEADIELWFRTCAAYIGSIHLQQTDGLWDRHWDFTKKGIVTPELIERATRRAGLDDIIQYLEIVTAYEDDDDAVYDRMKRTMDYLHRELGV